MKLNPSKVALTAGFVLSGWHVVWLLLIVLGFAQPLLDFIFWAHHLNNPYTVASFEITRAILLVVITFAVGYTVGFVASNVWNKVHK